MTVPYPLRRNLCPNETRSLETGGKGGENVSRTLNGFLPQQTLVRLSTAHRPNLCHL